MVFVELNAREDTINFAFVFHVYHLFLVERTQ